MNDAIVGPLNQANRQQCFNVQLINDNICGDDPGRFFTIELSSYAELVDINPFSTRIYVYDSIECSKLNSILSQPLTLKPLNYPSVVLNKTNPALWLGIYVINSSHASSNDVYIVM